MAVVINSLADFKRNIQVGTKIKATFHLKFHSRNGDGSINWMDEDKGIREVSIKQTNSFALKTVHSTGTIVDSWCAYPKASELKTNGSNTVEIMEQQRDGSLLKCLTYTFVD